MSTSKGSTPAAKASKGPTKLSPAQKDAIKKRKIEERKLPFAVTSSKYAPKSRRALYVNSKKAARKALGITTTKVARKPAAVARKPNKKQEEVTKKRKAERDAKKSAKKQRVAAVDAYVQSLGKTTKEAERAWVKSGRKINRELEPKVTPKPAGTKKVVVPRWGLAQRNKWRALIVKKPRKPLTFAQMIAYAKAGNRIPLTRGERLRASQAKAKAHDQAQKKAGKPAKELKGAAKRSAKRFAKFEKKMATKKAETQKRADDKKKGLKVKKVKKTTTTARPIIRRKDKKIHIVNLDRAKPITKKQYRARGNRQQLRASLNKGTVVIILRGKFAGRRAVFLKRLPVSGDLLVSGPFSVNGVPLYRISQNFVIATSTRVAVKGLPLAANLTDKIFRATKFTPKKHTEADFFAAERKTKNFPQLHRSQLQKTTDKFLEAEIKKTPLLAKYLQASFSLSDKDAPHAMVF